MAGSGAADEDICKALLDARRAQNSGAINNGDDDVDDDAPVEAHPRVGEVLQAASLIKTYLNGINTPFAHNLENVLASFGRQMRLEESRAMVPTHITDYFSHH